jgi:hypothetical protein
MGVLDPKMGYFATFFPQRILEGLTQGRTVSPASKFIEGLDAA